MSEIVTYEEIKKIFQYLANLHEDPNYDLFVKRMQEIAANLFQDEYAQQLFELGKAVLSHFLNQEIESYEIHKKRGLVI